MGFTPISGVVWDDVIMEKMTKKTPGKRVTNEKPIKLNGVKFTDLMRAFLQVKPNQKKAKKLAKQQ